MPGGHFEMPPCLGIDFVPTLHHKVPAGAEASSQALPQPFVVCVTGSSRGIGKATAISFAQAGATGLILTAREASSLEETKRLCLERAKFPGLEVSTVAANFASEADTDVAVGNVVDAVAADGRHGHGHGHGRLDVLVNNAGLVSTDASAWQKLEGIRPDQVRVAMEANYFARLLLTQRLLPVLLGSPGGARVVVNITSIASHLTTFGALGFNISELACNRLTEIVAGTYADRGLLCYAVHPGGVDTSPPPGMPPEVARSIAEDEPDLCGSMLLWLARERPAWLSGRYISSQWDTTELVKKREEIVRGDKLKAKMVV